MAVPTETLTKNGPLVEESLGTSTAEDEAALRRMAVRHIARVRKLKLHATAFVLGMTILVPAWIVTEYVNADGWPKRFSDNANPGDWNPWIAWVVLIWGFVVAVLALKAYFGRPTTEAEIERELERLRFRGGRW